MFDEMNFQWNEFYLNLRNFNFWRNRLSNWWLRCISTFILTTDVNNNQYAYYVTSANNVVRLNPITGVEQVIMPASEYVSVTWATEYVSVTWATEYLSVKWATEYMSIKWATEYVSVTWANEYVSVTWATEYMSIKWATEYVSVTWAIEYVSIK